MAGCRTRTPHVVSPLVAAIALGAACPAWALDAARATSQYALRSWDADDNLPPDAVQAIAQTPDGYLWLGTMGGLARFDGARFTLFDRRNSSLPHDNVWALRTDRQGRLWVGTDGGGLFTWPVAGGSSGAAPIGPAGSSVRPILETRDGALWVGTNGGGLHRGKNGQWRVLTTQQGLSSDRVWALAESASGAVWAGTNGGGLNRCMAERCEPFYTRAQGLTNDFVSAVAETRDGAVWVGTYGGGVARFWDGQWRTWTTAHGLPGDIVRVLYEDRQGNLWLGTNQGLARWRRGTFDALQKAQGAAGSNVRAIAEDAEGNLWVGYAGGGLTRLSDGQVLNLGRPEGLADDTVTAVLEDHHGTVWASTSRGVSRYEGEGRVTTLTTSDGLPSDSATALAEDPAGGMWIGTQAHGLVLWRGKVVEAYASPRELPARGVRCILPDRAGGLWVGTPGGLAQRSGGVWTVHREEDGLPNSYVSTLLETRDGTVWVGTHAGVARRTSTGWSVPEGGPSQPVYALYEDGAGALWVGTNGAGLYRLRDGRWSVFTSDTGWCDDHVFQILEDDLGQLWTSSPAGLCRASRRGLERRANGEAVVLGVRSYDRTDGMRTSQCKGGNKPAAWKTRAGRLLFATNEGIVVVTPSQAEPARLPPPVHIEQLLADGAAVPLDRPLRVGPGRPRLELRFSGISLTAPQKVVFRHRLEGLDRDWVAAGSRREAVYTNLDPGRYTFRVSAAGADGAWNETGASLDVIVEPYVHETTWFRVLAAVVVGSAIFGLAVLAHRLRLRQMRLRWETVVQERTRIARELHDTLAQGLAGMKLQIDSAAADIRRRPDAAERALRFAQAMVGSTFAEVRRSIWVLRAQEASDADGLSGSLHASLQQITRDASVRSTLDVAGARRPLDGELERNVLRIAHEALTNVVRHARAETVAVELRFDDDALRLRVRDDGCGFDPAPYLQGLGGQHFGLKGLCERAELVGGEMHVRSAPGAGTEIVCRLPYTSPTDPAETLAARGGAL